MRVYRPAIGIARNIVSGLLAPKVAVEQSQQLLPQKGFDLIVHSRLGTSPTGAVREVPLFKKPFTGLLNERSNLAE